jgi:hypothetical protein
MDPNQFDRIVTRLAEHRASRRSALHAMGAGVAAVSLGASRAQFASAQDATPVAGEFPDTVHPGAAAAQSEFLSHLLADRSSRLPPATGALP